jgi:hypothetical protein
LIAEHGSDLEPAADGFNVVRQRGQVEILATVIVGQPLVARVERGFALPVADTAAMQRLGNRSSASISRW